MALDLDFISALIKEGKQGLDTIRRNNIDESYLEDSEAKKVFKYILEFNAEFGETPAESVIEKYFGNSILAKPDQGLQFQIDQIQNRQVYKLTGMLANQIAETYNSNDSEDLWKGVDKVKQLVLQTSKKLILEGSNSSTGDITKSTSDRRRTYEERKMVSGITGIPTRWNVLTEATMGWQNGHTYMFLAKEGVGKTFNLLMHFLEAYERGYTPLFLTEEMTREELAFRADALMTGLNYEDIMKGRLTSDEEKVYFDHLEKLEKRPLPMFVNESAGPDGLDYVFELWSQIRPDIVFLDNVTLYFGDLDYKKITPQSNKIKKTAMNLQNPFVFCTHLNDSGSAMYSKALSHDATGVWIMSKDEEQDVMVFKNTKLRYGKKTDFATNWSFNRGDFTELGKDRFDVEGYITATLDSL